MTTATTTERGFTIVRRLDVPRELVFQAWTDPEHLVWFLNPATTPRHPTTVDLRVGGAWRLHMVENENKSYMTGGVYREIVPPEKLVFAWGAVDGWPEIDPGKPDDAPIVTVTLKDLGDATEMTFQVGFADHITEARIKEWFAMGIVGGWTDTIDRLDPHLSTAR
jgi:uncharacterized protein YndB with AHSA1/START domain